jgi:putative endonuclease
VSDARAALGAAGEQAAARHLEAAGYAIETRNWRCAVGELDLVAVRGDDLLVFVEVRTVGTDFLASPVLSVGPGKQRRVARAADAYLRQRPGVPERIRFDVIGVRDEGGQPRIEHVENAFVPSWAF